MKKLLSMVIIVTAAGLAFAGETETAALNAADLTGVNISAMRTIDVPAAPAAVKATSSAVRENNIPAAVKGTPTYIWVQDVKKEYLRLFNEGNLRTLPVAKISELPADAKQQLNADNAHWAPEYPSIPYKMKLQGMIAFIIHNENDRGMFVAIFDNRGNYIAAGCDEKGTFAWDDI